jgi:lipoprotein-releasing system permease protein
VYKFLLCWRYLKTRYLAFACIISVTLGVATLIVVNSVMSGFSTKLRHRLHALLSDVVLESYSLDGFTDPAGKMELIRKDPFLGPRVEAMAATMEVFAMMQYRYPNGEMITRPVRLIGVEPQSRAAIGGFREFLVDPKNKEKPSFELNEEAKRVFEDREALEHFIRQQQPPEPAVPPADAPVPAIPPPMPTPHVAHIPKGAIVGHLISHFRVPKAEDATKYEERATLSPGDSIILTTVSGQKLAPVYDTFVVVDYFKSEMSEYDSNYVFVPLDYLQHLRTMQDRVTSIEIKLRDYSEARDVVGKLNELFRDQQIRVETWEMKQGPLLKAIDIEKGILNVLLFMIIAVAGFGILAIFSMIVTEKTRDIGVLKALGASNYGVMKIFLAYGLLLGLVGTAFGNLLGLSLTYHINEVEQFLAKVSGQNLFRGDVYYFNEIPTDVQLNALLLVNIGAVLIAVLFSVLPALRAALLHPVQALRYE